MKFESGRNNLRDIHNFMSKIYAIREYNEIKSNNLKRLLEVETGIDEVKSYINSYKSNIQILKQYMTDFELLKTTHLKK